MGQEHERSKQIGKMILADRLASQYCGRNPTSAAVNSILDLPSPPLQQKHQRRVVLKPVDHLPVRPLQIMFDIFLFFYSSKLHLFFF